MNQTTNLKKKIKWYVLIFLVINFIILSFLFSFNIISLIILLPSDTYFLFSFLLDSYNLPNINWLVWNFASIVGNLIGPLFNCKVLHMKSNVSFSYPFTKIRYRYDTLIIFKNNNRITSNLAFTPGCGWITFLIILIIIYSISNYIFRRNINKKVYFQVLILLFVSNVILTMLRLAFIILGLILLLNLNYQFNDSFVFIHDLIAFFYFNVLYFYINYKIIQLVEKQSKKPFFFKSIKYRLLRIQPRKSSH